MVSTYGTGLPSTACSWHFEIADCVNHSKYGSCTMLVTIPIGVCLSAILQEGLISTFMSRDPLQQNLPNQLA